MAHDFEWIVRVFYFSDLHGFLLPRRAALEVAGGLPRIVAYIEDRISEFKGRYGGIPHATVLAVAGDIIAAHSPCCCVDRGASAWKCFEEKMRTWTALDKVVVSLGNHDLDFGADGLLQLSHDGHTLVCSDLRLKKSGKAVGEGECLFVGDGGIKILFVSVSRSDDLDCVVAQRHADFDSIQRVDEETYLQHGSGSACVCLCHQESKKNERLARLLKLAPHLLVEGHIHGCTNREVVGNSFLVAGGRDGRLIGYLDIGGTPTGVKLTNNSQPELLRRPHERLDVYYYLQSIYDILILDGGPLANPVGEATCDLQDESDSSKRPTEMGTLVANALFWKANKETSLSPDNSFSLIRGNAIYGSLPRGTIAHGQILECLPLSADDSDDARQLCVISLSAPNIAAVMEDLAVRITTEENFRGFPQISTNFPGAVVLHTASGHVEWQEALKDGPYNIVTTIGSVFGPKRNKALAERFQSSTPLSAYAHLALEEYISAMSPITPPDLPRIAIA